MILLLHSLDLRNADHQNTATDPVWCNAARPDCTASYTKQHCKEHCKSKNGDCCLIISFFRQKRFCKNNIKFAILI